MEKWSGKQPSLNYLKPFGCTAFAHVKQGKLEPRAIRCIFLGYPEGVKGYKLRSTESGNERTFLSRDVTFNESEFPMKVEREAHLHDDNFQKDTTVLKLRWSSLTYLKNMVLRICCPLH